jgi:hypothetical protein
MRTMRLEHLVNRVVRDEEGKPVGRIHEIRAEERDGELVIVEYHLGAHAFPELLGLSIKKLIGVAAREPRKVPWDQLDLSDPARPVLRSAI